MNVFQGILAVRHKAGAFVLQVLCFLVGNEDVDWIAQHQLAFTLHQQPSWHAIGRWVSQIVVMIVE